MMDTMKTYLPADYAAYLLERYAGKTEAEWIAFLEDDACRSTGERQIPFFVCGGRHYYDLWNVFQIISRHDINLYFAQLAAESGGGVRASSHPYAQIGFDASEPKNVGFVELVTQDRWHGNLKLTPDEARSLAAHLFSQADICSCQDFEATEYKDANETAEDALNAAFIEIGFTDEETVCETSKEAA